MFLIGQDGGVVVPKDAAYQFTSYDAANNNNENDFFYVKYLDFSKFYSNKTINMEYMLTGIGAEANIEHYDLSGFDTSNVTNMKGMFIGFAENNTKEINLDLSMFDTSKVTDMSWMFWEFGYHADVINLDLSYFDTSNVTDMSYMFYLFGGESKEVNLNIYEFDTKNVKTMKYMFGCFRYMSPNDFKIDYFKNWDTSNVTDMNGMFNNGSLGTLYKYPGETVIDLTGLDTSNVENFYAMFYANKRVKEIIGLDIMDTTSATNMGMMFYGVDVSDLSGVSNWDTSNLLSAIGMFNSINYLGTNPNPLKFLDLSNWDVSKIENISGMFNNTSFQVNLNGWELSNLSDCNSMFRYSAVDALDLSQVNFGNSSNYNGMFMTKEGNAFPSVIDLSGSDWNEEADTTDMFKGIKGSTIYVKDEKAKAFIEKLVTDCSVVIKE